MYQLFSADSDYTGVFAEMHAALSNTAGDLSSANEVFFGIYRAIYVLLYAFAPILTLGVILSIFKNLVAKSIYHANYFSDVYIFSELNERALALASSIVSSSNDEREAQ